MQTRTISVDGRRVCADVVGDGSAGTVLVSAGTPNSRFLYSRWVEDALARGVRLVGYDRPGYGGSDPRPGHTVADGVADIRAIAAELGVDRLMVWGYSGGGPYALACAALAPDLVAAVATLASVAPYGAPGLDFFTGMGEENVEDVQLYLDDRAAWRRKSEQERTELLDAGPQQLIDAWRTLLSDADLAVLTGDYAEYVVESAHAGLAPGSQGWCDDGEAHMSDWGFDLSDIRVPVKVWHGRQDRFVPFQHGEWLAEHIPGAEAELSEENGHLTLLVRRVPDVHDWLLGHV